MPKRVEIDDAVLAKVEANCPKYLSPTGFVNLLLDRALDTAVTLGLPSEAGSPSKAVTSKAVTSKEKTLKTYIEIHERISDELSFCRDDLIKWWALRRVHHGKKAVGTDQAWTASQNALLAILRAYGQQVVINTVQAGLANAWRSFRESYAVLPKQLVNGKPAQPEMKHPAHRDFTAERLERERRLAEGDQSIPSATGGRGVFDLL
jgi:hypothetical protein